MNQATEQQRKAIESSGGILLSAGAGTGKTATLVNRCVRLVTETGVDVDRILMVTFTNAAAAEMRQRIREALQKKLEAEPGNSRLLRQFSLLEGAYISTIHSFCAELVRSHFEELGLDPAISVLDEAVSAPLAKETVRKIVRAALGRDAAARQLAQNYCASGAERLGDLILGAHRFFAAQPQAALRIKEQCEIFARNDCACWKNSREGIIRNWLVESRPLILEQSAATLSSLREINGYGGNSKTADGIRQLEEEIKEVADVVEKFPQAPSQKEVANLFSQIQSLAASDMWVRGTKGKIGAFADLFEEVEAFSEYQPTVEGDPLETDWKLVRLPMLTLLELTQQFAGEFAGAKRAIGGVDFSDLEQFALQLLVDAASQPTDIARRWQARLDHVFVDECQDINAVQDAILRALSRTDGQPNLFMVGDVKQSIYRFRLAAPELFRACSRDWHGKPGHQVLPLTENFRSREGIIHFVNDLFGCLMQPALGDVACGDNERLQFGAPAARGALSVQPANAQKANGIWPESDCRVELHLIDNRKADVADIKTSGESDSQNSNAWSDMLDIEQQARVVAVRLRQLVDGQHEVWDKSQNQFRPMKWSDVGILLRSATGRTGAFVREFRRLDIPLSVEQGNFIETLEASDLISLLRLLDNPRQDIPLFAVLRSPLVGWSLDELVQLWPRTDKQGAWEQLGKVAAGELKVKVEDLRRHFEKWRKLALMTSLSCVLETVLADTGYEAYLLTLEDGSSRVANVRRFLELAQRYDPFQRQGLFRFLKFIEVQAEAENEIEPVPPRQAEAAQLLTIHKSKGLEFPVVVVAGIGGRFNFSDLKENIILSRRWGLCPQVINADQRLRHESLIRWQAAREEKLENIAEELRLFYVAVTRARDTLLLAGSFNSGKQSRENYALTHRIANAGSYCDWVRIWLGDALNGAADHGEIDLVDGKSKLRFALHRRQPEAVVATTKVSLAPETQTPRLSDEQISQFNWEYPHLAATHAAAKTSATALKHMAAETDEEASQPWQRRFAFESFGGGTNGKLTAPQRGLANHTFLEQVDIQRTGSRKELQAEAQRLTGLGVLTASETEVLHLDAILNFWTSETGITIARNAGQVLRELQFTAAFKPSELNEITGGTMAAGDDEFVVVQGAADLVLLRPEDIWIVDFKTDHFAIEELTAKIHEYSPQLRLYAAALQRIYRRPVTQCGLFFLQHPGLMKIETGNSCRFK